MSKIICGLGLLLMAAQIHAAPMGFDGSTMAMGDFSPNWREGLVNYALTPRDALGASYIYMRSDDETQTRDLAEITYTRLLKRWNMDHAQANIWFLGGLGGLRGNDFDGTKTMVSPGVQIDYETTRIYFAATQRMYRAYGKGKDLNHDFSSLRAGFSFYEAGYESTQPWFILEARRMQGLSEKIEFTPMLRLINKSYFIEAGMNNSSQLRFNFMYVF